MQFQNLDENDENIDYSNIQELQDESASFAVQRNVVATYEVNMEAAFEEFNQHFSHCNIDFKERIIKNVQTMKLKSTNELNQAVSIYISFLTYMIEFVLQVEEVKTQEAIELGQLNKIY